jgi:hypothetical protein
MVTSMKRALIVLVATTLIAVPGPGSVASGQAIEDPPQLTGYSAADFRAEVPTFVSGTGRAPGIYQLYWDLTDGWPNAWAAGILTELEDMGVGVPYVEITVRDTAASLAAGQYDRELAALVDSVDDWLQASPGRGMLVAPLPEANLVEHAYGGDPASYRVAYAKVREAFTAAGLGDDKVRFVFAMNGLSDVGFSYDQFYPGDDAVDVLGFAKLNRANPWRDYEVTFEMHIREMAGINAVKPMLVTQTGSVSTGGDRDAWLDDMFAGLLAEPQVVGAIYFNGRPELGFRVIGDGTVDPAFVRGVRSWSMPAEASWFFDGRADVWETARADELERLGGFIDTANSPFATDIAWMADRGITLGCNPPTNDRFCPDDTVTRGQMAAFLVRALGYTDGGSADFVDDDTSVFEPDIEKLAAAGVALGCNPPTNDRFCPDDTVTRGQMAAFLVRALGYTDLGSADFVDDDNTVFEGDIRRLATAGVTVGCNPPRNDRFCPDSPVTRGAMAAFLHRALVP